MFLLRATAVALALISALASASETEDFPRPGWRLTTTFIPRDYVLGPLGMARGATPLVERSGAVTTQYDVKQTLTSLAGIEFPPGALAIYEERGSTLVVVAPDGISSLPGTLCMICGWSEPNQIRVTASLAEFEIDRAHKMRNLPYERLRSVAGKSWRELELQELTVTTGNAQRGAATKRLGDGQQVKEPSPETEEPKRPLAPGEAGMAFDVEPVVGPDGLQVSLNYSWQRRLGLGRGEEAQQHEMTGSLIVTNGTSIVVSQWPANDPGTLAQRGRLRSFALVLRADILTSDGVPVRQAFAEGIKKFREIVRSRKRDRENAPADDSR